MANSRVVTALAVAWLVALTGAAVSTERLPIADPLAIDLGQMLAPPSAAHWAGTDELGRDVFSRIIFAARSTLLVTAGATALDLILALLLGATAGYFGGAADRILLFIIDLFWSVPFVVFVVLIVSVVGVSSWTLILTIGGLNWVTAARVVRAETVWLRRQAFVETAIAYGFSPWQVVFGHMLPVLRGTILTLTAYTAVEVMTLETGIAFIGLSLPAPQPTWGGLLADGLSYLSSSWYLALSASAAITITLASLQILSHRMKQGRAPEHAA